MSRRDYAVFLFRYDRQIDETFRRSFGHKRTDGCRFLRFQGYRQHLFLQGFSVSHEPADDVIAVVDRGEVETVGDTHFACLSIDRFEAYVLMSVFHFGHRRVRGTVGTDDAVTEEIAVARCVDAVIASVSPVGTSVFIRLANALIDPVPDESALQVRISVNCLPLLPKISVRVSHGMRIFRRHDRTVTPFATDFL